LTCTTPLEPKEYGETYLLAITGKESLPEEVKKQFKIPPQVSKKNPFYLLLSFTNDNKFLGAWSYIDNDGDDFGHTHGMDIELGARVSKTNTLKLQIQTDIYTSRNYYDDELSEFSSKQYEIYEQKYNLFKNSYERIAGGQYKNIHSGEIISSSHYNEQRNQLWDSIYETPVTNYRNQLNEKYNGQTPQDFFDMTMFKVSLDNKNANKVVYYDVGVGALVKAKNHSLPLTAGWSQDLWHEAWGSEMRQFHYEKDNGELTIHPVVQAAIGVQLNTQMGGSCQLINETQVGVQSIMLEGDENSLDFQSKNRLLFGKAESKNKLGVDLNVSHRQFASEGMTQLQGQLNYIRPRTVYYININTQMNRYSESMIPYQDTDSMMQFGIIKYFGGRRKTKP
jgi:hypothetical protein